jgi:predicted ATPase
MINWLRVKNFKSLADTGKIDIRPLTLLMGPNSSGKSSILQAILLLKQTAESRDVERSVQVDGDYIRLGPFRDFVFGHDTKRKMQIAVSITPDRPILFGPARSLAIVRPTRILPNEIVAEVTLGTGTQMQTLALKTAFLIHDEVLGDIRLIKTRGKRGAYTASMESRAGIVPFRPLKNAKFYDMTIMPGRRPGVSSTSLFYNLRRLSSYVTSQFEENLSRVIYLGPLREEPSRLYAGIAERPQDVGIAGEDAVHVLWLGKRERKQAELRRTVEKWMTAFDICKEMKLRQVEGPYFQLYFVDKHTGVKATLADVGFGASQLLPVIVAGYYAPAMSLIIEEQPEIHLHPKAQTTLADLFIDVSKQGKKMLIETHSEHVLSRVQRRIGEKHIDNESVAVYYCESSARGTRVRKVPIDKYGQLESDKLPRGFFDESYQESKAHMEAIVKSKKRQES